MRGKKSTKGYKNISEELIQVVCGVRITMRSWLLRSTRAPKPTGTTQASPLLPGAGLQLVAWTLSELSP